MQSSQTLQEALEYLNGRITAAMFVTAIVATNKDLQGKDILELVKTRCASELHATDTSPTSIAYAKGFESMARFLEDGVQANNAVDLMARLNDQIMH